LSNSSDASKNDFAVKVPGILLDLIPQYLANRRAEVILLTDAVALEDFSIIQNIGHKLKGNAGSYGFSKLTLLGSILEKAGQQRDLALAKKSISDYSEYLSDVYVVPE
jgi:HPt (histidine-containing phosphotransfer) domain-containing protein